LRSIVSKKQGVDMSSSTASTTTNIDLKDPSLYINRELSWVDFNARVLEEAQDANNPLLERVKFLAIFSNNLDEFFMVRVAGLRQQVQANVSKTPADGMTPAEQIAALQQKISPLLQEQRRCWQQDIKPALREQGIFVMRGYDELNPDEQHCMREHFRDEIFPILTPLAVDPGRPFPHISNLSLNLAVSLTNNKGQSRFARLKVPVGTNLPRFLHVSEIMRRYTDVEPRSPHVYIYLSEVIRANLDLLFPGMEIQEAHAFRVTRDADVEIAEDEASDLLETIEQHVRQRRFGQVVRLTVQSSMPQWMREMLMAPEHLDVIERDVYELDGPLGLTHLFQIASIDRSDLKYADYSPRYPSIFKYGENIFDIIKAHDFYLNHPYDSFTPVIDFIRSAAHDPDVLAIKMTLYRVGKNSPIVRALLEAIENGKQVAVLVELKARFDEANNITWARALESEGVHVVYGLVGLKVHAKTALVVRREGDGIRRYFHMGTGNYNASTSRIYTDIGFMSDDQAIANDLTELFNRLTGYSPSASYKKLLVAPEHMRFGIEELIEREIEHARAGRPAYIIMKSNSLVDAGIIRKLYQASQAGVKIDLLIRGICCLKPGLAGISDNIHVSSIVGRYLEHSRVYYFQNNGDETMYCGSADMMDRNLNRRVETLFPIENPTLRKEILDTILRVQLNDNVRTRVLNPDGTWTRVTPAEDERALDSHEWAMKYSHATTHF
jgi:polyphosphate kinase